MRVRHALAQLNQKASVAIGYNIACRRKSIPSGVCGVVSIAEHCLACDRIKSRFSGSFRWRQGGSTK